MQHALRGPGLALILGFAVCGSAIGADTPMPGAGHRVVDQSHVLNPDEIRELADRLKAIEDASGAQIAILTVPSAGDEGIAPFANRVFVAWGLGRRGEDNGLLIVLATGDRKVRIEVGRGLEGSIPDITAKRITADIMGPEFKAGRYAAGFKAGVEAIASHIDVRDSSPAPEPPPDIGVPSSELGGRAGPILWSTLVFAFLALIGIGIPLAIALIARKRGWKPGSGYSGDSSFGSAGSSASSSSSSSSSDSNDSSGGGGDSAGGGADSSY